MQFSSATVIEAAIIALAISMDAFVASFAYGSNKIRIPMLSINVINIICNIILGVSLVAGTLLRSVLPGWFTLMVCFVILFILGIVKLFDGVTKSIIRKHNDLSKEIKFSMFNFHFILNLYANPEAADVDASKVISLKEAISLAVALSLDGIAVGFGAALGNANAVIVLIMSFVTGGLAVLLGSYCGNKIANRLNFNISWISGVVLIVLAFTKLI